MSTRTPLLAGRGAPRPAWSDRARTPLRLVAALVGGTALLVLTGWVARSEALIGFGLGGLPMRFNAALWFLALSAGLVLRAGRARTLLLGTVAATALVTVAQYLFAVDLAIDQALMRDWAVPEVGVAGRPAGSVAAAALVISLAGVVADRGRRRIAEVALAFPALVSACVLLGFLYGSAGMADLGAGTAMAPHTAASLLLLSLATAFRIEGGVLSWIAFGEDTGAALQRRLIPVGLTIPVLAWLLVGFPELVELDAGVRTALLVLFLVNTLFGVALLVGREARRQDQERQVLLDELSRVNADLEDRIRSRSHQLHRQRNKLALFEERDRIARDLHDKVIQRVFAAGLQVSSLGRVTQKEARARGEAESPISRSLDAVATELDMAIRELRNSIFELTSVDEHDGVEQVVRDIAGRASRILGFMPRVEVTGQVAGLGPDLVAQVASVIQEGLSNIARHAQARGAEVVLEADDDHVELRISDDGVGLPDPLPRSSGISNLMSRARKLGGSATWANGEDGGTVLVWRVARESLSEAALTRPGVTSRAAYARAGGVESAGA